MSERRSDGCVNCGEVREIAARGLCFKCYRAKERASERQFAAVDRHNPGIRREHKKLFRGFTSVMAGLSDLGAQKRDVLVIRRMLDPYVAPIAEFLGPALEREKVAGAVNSEPKSGDMFTVHSQAQIEQESFNEGEAQGESKCTRFDNQRGKNHESR